MRLCHDVHIWAVLLLVIDIKVRKLFKFNFCEHVICRIAVLLLVWGRIKAASLISSLLVIIQM